MRLGVLPKYIIYQHLAVASARIMNKLLEMLDDTAVKTNRNPGFIRVLKLKARASYFHATFFIIIDLDMYSFAIKEP